MLSIPITRSNVELLDPSKIDAGLQWEIARAWSAWSQYDAQANA